jgi:hypothetical protein
MMGNRKDEKINYNKEAFKNFFIITSKDIHLDL